jgi:hypothetical protein
VLPHDVALTAGIRSRIIAEINLPKRRVADIEKHLVAA